MLALRTAEGLNLTEFARLFGCDFLTKYAEAYKKTADYVEVSEDGFKIRDEFLFVQNSIIIEYLNAKV